MQKRLLKDVGKMSPLYQTSVIEAFHSLILKFCPKNVVYSFTGMFCRHVCHVGNVLLRHYTHEVVF